LLVQTHIAALVVAVRAVLVRHLPHLLHMAVKAA
jgi:hypothetical protein